MTRIATKILHHPNGATTRVPAHMLAGERIKAPVTMEEWKARNPPKGFFERVWGNVTLVDK